MMIRIAIFKIHYKKVDIKNSKYHVKKCYEFVDEIVCNNVHEQMFVYQKYSFYDNYYIVEFDKNKGYVYYNTSKRAKPLRCERNILQF